MRITDAIRKIFNRKKYIEIRDNRDVPESYSPILSDEPKPSTYATHVKVEPDIDEKSKKILEDTINSISYRLKMESSTITELQAEENSMLSDLRAECARKVDIAVIKGYKTTRVLIDNLLAHHDYNFEKIDRDVVDGIMDVCPYVNKITYRRIKGRHYMILHLDL